MYRKSLRQQLRRKKKACGLNSSIQDLALFQNQLQSDPVLFGVSLNFEEFIEF